MSNISKDIRFRVYICFILMIVFGLAILARASYIIVKEGKTLRHYADSVYTKIDVMKPERGNIYTEDGSLLASSIPEFELRVDFSVIEKDTFYKYIDSLSYSLSAILNDKSKIDYQFELQEAYKKQFKYYRLARNVNYSNFLKIKSTQPFSKGANRGGLIAESKTKRQNPFGMLANRTVGIFRDNAPNVGLEAKFNKELSGKNGKRIMKKIAGGTWMPIDGSELSPVNGRDLYTTLDMNIQDVAENALYKQLAFDQAIYGTCIVMEVKTGKIKALANLGKQADGTYYEDKNYALLGIEPGSTTKAISLISLLQDKKINIKDVVNCETGKIKVGRHIIDDDHHVGTVNIIEAFAQSSNVGFSKLMFQNYSPNKDAYYKNLKRLHLDKPTGIEIEGESRNNLNYERARNEKYFIASMGIGYGIQLTPLHMCMVYNTIANNGVLMKPYLVNEIKEYGKTIHAYKPTVLNNNAINKNVIEDIKDAMYAVVDHGTGKKLKNPYYQVCGKTGTALIQDGKASYGDRNYHASFIGFFPKENPQYTIAVIVRARPNSPNYYGGSLALPVFQEVANRLYATHVQNVASHINTDSLHQAPQIKNMRKSDLSIIAKALNIKLPQNISAPWVQNVYKDSANQWQVNSLRYEKNKVPNVLGMGLRNAVYLLEESGLKVISIGKGKVQSQSISANENVKTGSTITIKLS